MANDAVGSSGKAPSRGVSQQVARAQNERLVVNLLRTHNVLSAAEIARHSGLSAQTVSVILRLMEKDEIILRGEPQRGRVGQPSVPISLNPDGAFFLGALTGRRSAELIVVDFVGNIRLRYQTSYLWPDADTVIAWLRDNIADARAELGPLADRIEALGLAIPFRIWDWSAEVSAPEGALDAWKHIDLPLALRDVAPVIHVVNDATAACAGELAFGAHEGYRDVLYFFIGTFIGGGLAKDGSVIEGPTGNAGAMASILVPDGRGRPVQLLDCASLLQIDHAVQQATGKPAARAETGFWSEHSAIVQPWLDRAGRSLAFAIVSASAVTDSRDVVIDGAFPRHVHEMLLSKVERYMAQLDTAGIDLPRLRRGTLGSSARALGAAAQVMTAFFADV